MLSEIRAAVLAGESLDRILNRMRGRALAEDLVEARLAAYVRDFERSVEQGRRSPNSLRELARYAHQGGHFSWWEGRSVHEISTANLREWALWLGDRVNQRNKRRLSLNAQKNVLDLFRPFVRRLADDGLIPKVPKFPSIQRPAAGRDEEVEASAGGMTACVREESGGKGGRTGHARRPVTRADQAGACSIGWVDIVRFDVFAIVPEPLRPITGGWGFGPEVALVLPALRWLRRRLWEAGS